MAKTDKINNETELFEYATTLADCVGRIREAEAEMTARINAIRDSYADANKDMAERATRLTLAIETYVKKHPEIFPRDRKSVAIGSVIITKRTTPPKVGIPTSTTWDEAVERLCQAQLNAYVRTIQEVNKEAIIEQVETDDQLRGQLAKIGITVTQKEQVKVEVGAEKLLND